MTVAPDDPDLRAWLELLADTPHGAVVTAETRSCNEPTWRSTPCSRMPVSTTSVSRPARSRDSIDSTSSSGGVARPQEHPRRDRGGEGQGRAGPLPGGPDQHRRARVALSRSTETLILLDAPDAETDPLLQEIADEGLVSRRSIAFLRARLEERNADPRERAIGFLEDTLGLLETDLDRALRTLIRAEAALAGLVDTDQRREVLERSIDARRAVASALARQGRHAEAARLIRGRWRSAVRSGRKRARSSTWSWLGATPRRRRARRRRRRCCRRCWWTTSGPRRPRRRRPPGAAVRALSMAGGSRRARNRQQRGAGLAPGECPPAGGALRRLARRRDGRAPRGCPGRRHDWRPATGLARWRC